MNPRSSARIPTRTRRPFHSSAYRGPCPVDLRPRRAPPETKREREIKREAERHTREEYRRDSSGEYVHKIGVTCVAKSFDKVSKQLEDFPRRVRLGKTTPKMLEKYGNCGLRASAPSVRIYVGTPKNEFEELQYII